jgi:radical SAM protein with 4Fe4S-binding SPASM domain
MTLELAKHIVDDAIGVGIKKFSFGDNGDALMNKSFLDIVRYERNKCRDGWIGLTTNFQLMTPDIVQTIISEDLIDSIIVNIDGSNAESYERFKNISYKTVKSNLENFFKIRNKLDGRVSIGIQSVPYAYYRSKVAETFGKLPKYLENDDLPDDFDKIVEIWLPKLKHTDTIVKCPPYGWALRDLCTKDAKLFKCTFLEKIERIDSIYVAPNGDWYACCFMDEQNIVFGNLTKQTIIEIANSENRRVFIERLKNRNYELIGYPCTKVESCQYMWDR